MARYQETAVFPTTYNDAVDDYEEAVAASGCGCFRRFCFGWDDGESRSYLLQEKEGEEFSELVAGPKWKNLVRKINKICNPRKYNKPTIQFQYSPESYALNFAGGDQEEEDGNLLHSFSTRFAPGFSINDQQRRAAM
ncbi:hypothetical protein Pfo_000616 [Paulownia fortunei]|nr:hypothetical protein Pfo_000616 [Paulownia fortunei]